MGEQILSAIAAVVFLGLGLKAIITREVGISDDSGSEPETWVYGWRALAMGLFAIAVAVFFFAFAIGILSWAQFVPVRS